MRRAGVAAFDEAALLAHLEGRCARYRWPDKPRWPSEEFRLEQVEQGTARQHSVTAKPVGRPPEGSAPALGRSMQLINCVGPLLAPPFRPIETPVTAAQHRVNRCLGGDAWCREVKQALRCRRERSDAVLILRRTLISVRTARLRLQLPQETVDQSRKVGGLHRLPDDRCRNRRAFPLDAVYSSSFRFGSAAICRETDRDGG